MKQPRKRRRPGPVERATEKVKRAVQCLCTAQIQQVVAALNVYARLREHAENQTPSPTFWDNGGHA